MDKEKIVMGSKLLTEFPKKIRHPAAKVYPVSRQELVRQEDGIPSSHASTVLPLQDGTVLAAWFGGTGEKDPDVRIWVAKRDVFGIWSRPQKVTAIENTAHWNPVLDQKEDGTIRLYFKCHPNIPDWKTFYADSTDGGLTFSQPVELVKGDESGGRGPVKDKCIRTSKGLLLAPASTEQNRIFRIFVDISRDDGDTWEKTPFIDVKNPSGDRVQAIQPTLWEDADGEIHLLCRTKNDGYIYKSDSRDGGFTWNTAYRIGIYNNFSGIDCCTTEDGSVWLLCNPVKGEYYRSPLRLFVSRDNGITWLPVIDLERDPFKEYSYPAIVSQGNRLYCTYTNDRKNITFAELEL